MEIIWEITFQILVLIFLAILVSKAFEIRDLLETLIMRVGKGKV